MHDLFRLKSEGFRLVRYCTSDRSLESTVSVLPTVCRYRDAFAVRLVCSEEPLLSPVNLVLLRQ